tara:strand:- start:992 stop:1792 length:801 start_codon:yes stop_codon:yes gene_type:complete
MSLAVLKKKSTRYKSVISGKDSGGFSINGGHRSQGWVGQDTLGRHLVGTPFRGTEPMGNGGCCGSYVKSIVNRGNCCSNDPKVIKRSTLNTRSYIDVSIRHPTGVFNDTCNSECSKEWVQNFSPLDHSQSTHISNVKAKTVNECNEKKKEKKKKCDEELTNHDSLIENDSFIKKVNDCKEKSVLRINGKKFYISKNTKRIHKNGISAVPSGEYTIFGFLEKKNIPLPANRQPFPMKVNHHGCNKDYLTPQEAIDDGALPEDWMQKK